MGERGEFKKGRRQRIRGIDWKSERATVKRVGRGKGERYKVRLCPAQQLSGKQGERTQLCALWSLHQDSSTYITSHPKRSGKIMAITFFPVHHHWREAHIVSLQKIARVVTAPGIPLKSQEEFWIIQWEFLERICSLFTPLQSGL